MYSSSSNYPIYDDHGSKAPPAYGVPITPQQPGNLTQYVPYPGSEVPWSTGLCECSKDLPNCFMTFWCRCVTFGRVAEIVDRGSTSCGASGALYTLIALFTGCACIYSCFYRTKMRKQFLLGKRPYNDCMVHFCCEACALCQEYREVQNRGFVMSLGWHGNIERQQQQQLQRGMRLAPPMEIGMTR